MLKKKRFLLLGVAFLAFSLLLVACGGDDTDVPMAGDDTDVPMADGGVGVTGASDEIIIGFGGEIPTLDPHAENLLAASQVFYHTANTLVNQNADLEIYPGLAHSWEQLDELSWQFNLRDDVYFHNGDKMTAAHVEFSLTRAANAPSVEPVVGMINPDGFEVVDDYTIIIRTNYPFAPFLNHLAHNAALILNKNVLGDLAPGDALNEYIVTTGPYQILEHIPGDRFVMERWDDYHGDRPNMRLITYRIIPDAAARSIALETGEIDAMMAPLPTDIERLENHNDITVHYVVGLGVEYIILNNYHIPDVRVRQAMNYAVNGPQMVNVITQGTAVYASGFINNITFGHNPNFVGFPYDVERARELMIEAGFSGEADAGDLSFVIYANSENAVRQQSAVIVQNHLRQIGIDLEIRSPEFNAMMDLIRNRQIPMATLGWGTVTGDADYAMFPLFHSSAVSPSTNHALLENAAIDVLIEQARSSTDPDERIALYWEAQDLIREAAPWILVSNNVIRVPAQNNVAGLTVMAHQGHFFGNIYFTE